MSRKNGDGWPSWGCDRDDFYEVPEDATMLRPGETLRGQPLDPHGDYFVPLLTYLESLPTEAADPEARLNMVARTTVKRFHTEYCRDELIHAIGRGFGARMCSPPPEHEIERAVDAAIRAGTVATVFDDRAMSRRDREHNAMLAGYAERNTGLEHCPRCIRPVVQLPLWCRVTPTIQLTHRIRLFPVKGAFGNQAGSTFGGRSVTPG